MGPPLGLCTYPNEYVIEGNGGKEIGRVIEENNYCCQKCICPSARGYESKIFVKQGGNTYTAKRSCTLGSFIPMPCCMPSVKIFDSHSNQIGLITQPYCPMLYCKYEVLVYKGAEANEANLFRKIKKCAINCHSCCSVQTCGCCGKEMQFEVVDSMGNSKETLKKVHFGCYNECCTAGDKYECTLPSSEVDAAIFVAAV
jgi:hypothetical protein